MPITPEEPLRRRSTRPTTSTASTAASRLRTRLLGAALAAPEFKSALGEAASEILTHATDQATEATIEGCFERVVYALLREIGLKFHPEKEAVVNLQVRRHLTRGRTDSRIGALVIEYKRPALLRTAKQQAQALNQLEDYLVSLSSSSASPFVGLLTNGRVVAEVSAASGKVTTRSSFEPLSASSLARMADRFVALSLTALTATNLIRDFCGSASDGVLFRLARLLEDSLATRPQPKTDMLRSEWCELFRLAHDDQSQQKRIEERRAAMGVLFDLKIEDADTEYRALFALHTAYAIALKCIAFRVVSDAYLGRAPQNFKALSGASASSLRSFCSRLEDGEVFRQLGVINLLEGDFFSWYCDSRQWSSEIAGSIDEILRILARYEEARRVFDSGHVSDLFRGLYEAAVPRVVRSSFGEFYTPPWLAERLLDAADLAEGWRVIDPCCGSGTVLLSAIARLRSELAGVSRSKLLEQILGRVVGIDLNPLAVLTSRIHYFIHIADLLDERTEPFVVPVFLGDATGLPEEVELGGVPCIRIGLRTLRSPIDARLPRSLATQTVPLMNLMPRYEGAIKLRDAEQAEAVLWDAIEKDDRKPEVRLALQALTRDLISLEEKGWNGIWARILSNFLSTACLGKFSAVVGNPPWIDWKNLPATYRERIKGMCIDRGLFSGAGRTGGINLNIAALIAHVAMSNWLQDGGRLAFLMPRELALQASYEGWRRLSGRWHFLEFHDWSNAGHPFDPVREDFMTFVIASKPSGSPTVPVRCYAKARGTAARAADWKDSKEAEKNLVVSDRVAGPIIPGSTAFTFADSATDLESYSLVAGDCEYVGREGVEFYPQELLLFTFQGLGPKPGTAWLKNVQVEKAKYRIPARRLLLETKYLHPLVKGRNIEAFEHRYDDLIVPFPYEATSPLRPIPQKSLSRDSALLLKLYEEHREIMEKQTKFSDKIRGPNAGEYYGLARTGPYSFAEYYVCFRDNTKWGATVVSSAKMPWGERRRFLFQNHAVSICERSSERGFIDEDEAHYICAILNATIVEAFILSSSDERSFKVRPPVRVPRYDPGNSLHAALAQLSRDAHASSARRTTARREATILYLRLLKEANSPQTANPTPRGRKGRPSRDR